MIKHKRIFVSGSAGLVMIMLTLLVLPGMSATANPNVPEAAYNTIIVVDTTSDPDSDSLTKTCDYTSGIYYSDTPCSFRRALVEASHRPPADRPILIRFDLTTEDSNYDAATETWTIVMEADYSSSAGGEAIVPNNITEPDGYITINGNLQPGGRADGPKILIDNDNVLDVLSEHNTIRNLAFIGGGGVFLNESSNVGGYNTVESVWTGLRADGQEIDYTGDPISLAGAGISIQSDGNTVSDSVVTGSSAGITVQGDDNVIQQNYIGTRSDGTVPADRLDCDNPSNVYNPDVWYGGWGIQLYSGSNHQIISNTIAGIHTPHSATETYPPAISTAGSDVLVAYNAIGIDSAGSEVGVCGQAIHVTGHDVKVRYNTIVNARSSYTEADSDDPTEGAVFVNDSSPQSRKYTIRDNIVRDSTEKVIYYGPSTPEELRLFEPPRIVSVDGTQVVGETEEGYDCPNCLVELYLDDLDDGQDALELLTTATIDDVAGIARFTATMTSQLPDNRGIRVAATTQDDYVIGDFLAGTTTKLSPAYGPDAGFSRDLAPGWNFFSIDVTPPSSAIANVLSGIAGQYDIVLGFENGPSGGGLTYDPDNPGASDLTTIDVMHGYWINITAAATQTLTLDYEPARNDTAMTLYPGWNMVSYLPDVTMPVTEALASIAGEYEIVQGFDGTARTYMPGSPEYSDLTELKPGFAYWIKIKDNSGAVTLKYPGYLAQGMPFKAEPSSATSQGAAASDFFTPTTEWVDFYGVATLSGAFSVPDNAIIVAYDANDVAAGAFTVHTAPYYGFLHVYADDTRTTTDEGAEAGDEIRFTINGRLAEPSKTTTWGSRGDVTEVNLDVTMPFVATPEWADFWGTLTIDGAAAPVGTIVAAYDANGIYCGDFIVAEAGQYGFLHVYGDDTSSTADEGAETGDSISFKAFLPLSDVPITLTPSGSATWQGRGSRTEINLSGDFAVPGAPTAVNISGPTMGQVNTLYTFTITVDPIDVTTPLTYTIERTDRATPLVASLDRSIVLSVTWATPNTKVVTVTAENDLGSARNTYTIEISEAGSGYKIYLPAVMKAYGG